MNEYLEFAMRHPVMMGAVSAVIVMILVTEVRRTMRRYQEVTVTQAVQLINREDAILLDVREDAEHKDSALPNAQHIALSQLPSRVEEVEKLKQPVITYCRTGVQSHRACRLLSRQGIVPIYNLKGGLTAWQTAGMPMESLS